MIIPPSQLPPQTLQNILEEYITREGTDYGEVEQSLNQNVVALQAQVQSGAVLIVFDEASESINLMAKEDYFE